MPKALAPLKEEWFTLPSEQGDPQATQFLVRPLSGPERADVEIYRDANGNWTFTGESVRSLLRFGLRGWKNFRDDDGEVVFIRGDDRANLARLDLETTTQLATEIWMRSALTEEQRKNFALPSTSPSEAKNSTASVASSDGTATSETPPPSQNGASRG